MSDFASISTDQGAALLWLRAADGRAGCDADGNVAAGRDRCPIVFTAFAALEALGLVTTRLGTDAAGELLQVLITEAGTRHPIEPAAERRLDQLMRRFDD